MLGIVLLINIVTVALCSPSRYPFVFLLDIGNEEIQETKNEQIRVSMGGGSTTLRYPALGDGELITHVRVTAVDFGANLMATVVDGGPGYKYAVVVVAGNKNSPYEVLLTFDTLKDSKNSNFYEQTLKVSEAEADVNDSSEDITDMNSGTPKMRTNQNFDNNNVFVESHPKDVSEDNVLNENEDSVNLNESAGLTTADEINAKYNKEQENPIELPEYQQYYRDDQLSYASHSPPDGVSIERNDPDEYNLIEAPRHEDEVPKAEPYSFVRNEDQTDEEQSVGVEDQNLYDNNKALRPHLAEDVQAYSYTPGDDVDRQVSVEESPEEIDQMFNDEEIHNSIPKPQDSNNNNYIVDTDETSAVAY